MLSLAYAVMSIAIGTAQLAAGGSGVASGPNDAEPVQGLPAAAFSTEARAVSNWRGEAMRDLAPTPLSVVAVALGAERPVITRCVKLNNYWCIKSARWNGEVGADDEGHTGFASAEHGADAAVRLLRRYYLEFDRRSALDIVRRWAPAECRLAGSSSPPAVLALRGLGNTLRARWLSARGALPGRTRVAATGATVPVPPRSPTRRISSVPLRPLPTVSMPSIMAGIALPKPPAAAASPSLRPSTPTAAAAKTGQGGRAATASFAAAAPPQRPAPGAAAAVLPRPGPMTCAPDEQRIQNYAGRIVEGLDLAPGADLGLFDPDGRPQPNLARVLLAMSAFELGYLRASADLVQEAIARATPPVELGAEPMGGASGSGL